MITILICINLGSCLISMPLRRLNIRLLLLLIRGGPVAALPVLAVLGSWLQWDAASAQILREMARTVLPDYAWTTLRLCLMVGAGCGAGGYCQAAAVTLFDFPGRRTFEWALLLPLAMPAYVVAYAYTDFLQFSGPLQTWLRAAPSACRGGCCPRCAAWPARPGCSRFRCIPMCTCWRAPR
jgi:ABC-type Fe3+ transport system permease subunit